MFAPKGVRTPLLQIFPIVPSLKYGETVLQLPQPLGWGLKYAINRTSRLR